LTIATYGFNLRAAGAAVFLLLLTIFSSLASRSTNQ
jgi:hypothetical protein